MRRSRSWRGPAGWSTWGGRVARRRALAQPPRGLHHTPEAEGDDRVALDVCDRVVEIVGDLQKLEIFGRARAGAHHLANELEKRLPVRDADQHDRKILDL